MSRNAVAALLVAVSMAVAGLIAYLAFSITSDIESDPTRGITIFLSVAFIGAGILIAFFLWLMRKQHRRDRRER